MSQTKQQIGLRKERTHFIYCGNPCAKMLSVNYLNTDPMCLDEL